MPLPAALAARLAKRGIISKKSAQQQSVKQPDEEVFAESYDDHEDVPAPKTNVNTTREPAKIPMVTNAEAMEQLKYMGYQCCPNKWNVYHECLPFCQNYWKKNQSTGPEPGSEYAEKYKVMMEHIGELPEEWQEKWDPGTGRHYYWCTRTDKVSWLPPGHPKAKITEAASRVREMIQHQIHMEPDRDEDDDSEDEMSEDDQAMDLDSDMDSDQEEEERRRREREIKRKEDKRKEHKSKSRDSGTLDPMDPASYSEAPRGDWSSGLDKQHGPSQGDV